MKNDVNYTRIKEAMEYIASNMKNQPQVDKVADHVHMSKFHFQRIFKEWAGVSPKKFLQYLTLSELKKNIQSSVNISELMENVGLSAQSRVYDLFVTIEAVTPYEYKTKGDGIIIEYGFHSTPFGRCLIATTSRGVCALEFIDSSETESMNDLREKWRNAKFQFNEEKTGRLIKSIFYSAEKKNIKALLFGTPFQIKVWEALVKIPSGRLSTYSDIANHIDNPMAARAVGTAIGKNNLAVIIPCHRIIKSIGEIGEYKWGKGRKASIIGMEKMNCNLIGEADL